MPRQAASRARDQGAGSRSVPQVRLPRGLTAIGIGALAGCLATGPMTALILAGQAGGRFRTPPPAQIHQNAVRRSQGKASVPATDPPERIGPSWLVSHFGFGAACGAGYSVAFRQLPLPATGRGVAYGLLIWAINYLGVLPALRIYPRPEHDRSARQAVMIAAHVVFGCSLATIEGELVDAVGW